MLINILFYFFSFNLILTSSTVVLTQNSVYSAFFLVLSFISAASILFLFECSFIAIIFIIIYVGAIAILFIFVVMMLNVKTNKLISNSLKYFPFNFFIFSAFLIEVYYLLSQQFSENFYSVSFSFNFYENWLNKVDFNTEMEALGQILFSSYVIQFLVAGLILLLSVLGSVVLVFNFNSNDQDAVFKQNVRKSNILLF